MLTAAKQFFYALVVLFVMLIAGYTILNFIQKKGGSSWLGSLAGKTKNAAEGAGIGG